MPIALTGPIDPASDKSKFRLIHVAALFKPIVLDMVSTLFFAGLYALTDNLLLATAVGVAAGVAQVVWRLATKRAVAPLQWAGLGLVMTTASIALVTHSPLVIMLKPTIIYLVIGVAMMQPGWMARYAPPFERSPIPPAAFIKAGHFVCGVMLVSSALNLYFALETTPKIWTAFIAVYPMASKLASFGLTFIYLSAVARRNKRKGVFFPRSPVAAAPQVV